jgi:hypothetical protein
MQLGAHQAYSGWAEMGRGYAVDVLSWGTGLPDTKVKATMKMVANVAVGTFGYIVR